jgi:hypothetical protein
LSLSLEAIFFNGGNVEQFFRCSGELIWKHVPPERILIFTLLVIGRGYGRETRLGRDRYQGAKDKQNPRENFEEGGIKALL